MVKGYLDGFDMYQISSPPLQQQVDDYKKRLKNFADSISDIAVFYPKFAESGLQEEYSALITKVAMAGMGNAGADGNAKTDQLGASSAPVISVRDFLEQYRASYDEIKKAGYRKRAEAAYEKIFAVADRTSDMLDAQIILEQERLLWNIVPADSLDIFAPILEAMDPLQQVFLTNLELNTEAYQKAQSAEELEYLLEKIEYEVLVSACHFNSRLTVIGSLSYVIMMYDATRIDAAYVGRWADDGKFHAVMLNWRNGVLRTLDFLKKELGMTVDDVFADDPWKIWLLTPSGVDDLGRIKESLHYHNFDVIRDYINNEMLNGLAPSEILKREPENVFWWGFNPDLGPEGDIISEKAHQKAKELNAHLIYYQYQDQLGRAGGAYTEKIKEKVKDAKKK